MQPKLTIVIITRNQGDVLQKALGRVECPAALRHAVELIVVDDCSDPQNQCAAMQSVSDLHARTGLGMYEYLTEWGGIGGARNRGLELAKGEYVWITDGDDLIWWESLPAILQDLNYRGNASMLMLDYDVVHGVSGELQTVEYAGHDLKPWECGVMVWHKIIRRDLYGRFRERVCSEDVDWWMRQCLNMEAVDGYVAPGIVGYTYYRLRPGSVTGNGEHRTAGKDERMLGELRAITQQARELRRPQAFVDHLVWLYDQYERELVP